VPSVDGRIFARVCENTGMTTDWGKQGAIAGYGSWVWAAFGIGVAIWLGLRTQPPATHAWGTAVLVLSVAGIYSAGIVAAAFFNSKGRQSAPPGEIPPSSTSSGDTTSAAVPFKGRYNAEGDRNYVNAVIHLQGNFYAVTNPDWDGVGIFERSTYWGIYKYKDIATYPNDRGKRGIHRFEMRFEHEKWLLRVDGADVETGQDDKDILRPWDVQGKWFREES